MSIIRVLPGELGLALLCAKPLVLLPGRHLFEDPAFEFVGFQPMSVPHIAISTTNIITVSRGWVGLCMANNITRFLEPGVHRINNARFTFAGLSLSTNEHISHGSKHRVVVPSGKVRCVPVASAHRTNSVTLVWLLVQLLPPGWSKLGQRDPPSFGDRLRPQHRFPRLQVRYR